MPLGLSEVANLLDKSPATRKAILVGGQALNVLAVHYKLDAIATAVSNDIDFFGNAQAAREAGLAWGGQTRVATIDDYTPNSAYVLVEIGGETHQIDFMADILGVKAKELVEWAAEVDVGSKTFRVMHPLHVLQSQMENVYGKLDRRSMGIRAVTRTRLAIQVAARAIHNYLEIGDTRAALRAVERIAEVATTEAALRAWHLDDIELLSAIPEHKNWPVEFTNMRLLQIRESIARAKELYRHRHPLS